MKRNKTFFYGSLIALAAGLLIFPNHTFAEEQASPLIATGTTVIATDTTQVQPEYSGWQNIDGRRYYFSPETHQKVTGEQEIDHVFYLFDWNGVQKTGWRTVNGKRVYFDPETGTMQTGWISVYDNRYYADADGKEKLLTKDYYVDVEKSVVRYPGYAVGAEVPESERPPALPTGWKLTIYREVPVTQETDLPDQYPFNQVEAIGDKLTMIAQQLTDTTDRSLKIGVSKSTDIDTVIPWENGKSFRISDDGKTLELSEDPAKVLPLAQGVYAQTQAQAQIASASAAAAAKSEDSAFESAGVAGNSAQYASLSAASAAENAELTSGYKQEALTAKADATASATNAKASEANAKTSENNAEASKEAAQSAATTASNYASASRGSANEAQTFKTTTQTYMNNAELYMNNAKNYSENVNVFIPSVSSSGVLSWTNKAGLDNPASVNMKGAKGDKGDAGAQGIQGAKGDKGDKGEQGLQGIAGTAATIRIGSVTTGEPGTNVSVTNSGTSSAAILNFQIPRGTPGADGGVTVDEVLNATSFNPIANRTVYAALQDKVSQTDLNELALTSGTLTTPSSSKAFVSKIVNDTLAPINNITQLTIEQSADGETWETLFDSATTTDEKWKKAYVSGLIFPSYLNITKGYMARITVATHTTIYFSSISFYMKAINSNDDYGSPYKCYYGFNTLDTTVAKVSGSIDTWGSWANTIFKNTGSNIVQYVFNEDKNEDITLLFGGALCKGTKAYRNVLNYDSDKGSTVTEYPVEAPAFIGNLTGTADKAKSDGEGNVITETYAKKDTANKWNALQSFKQVLLGAERYLSTVVSGTSHTPQMSVMHYIAIGTFTLNLQKIEASLEPSNSSVFTAYIESSADYPLHIETAGALKYIGSASDIAITSAGLLLNIMMLKDASGNVTSIVQASKLEGGA